MAPANVDTRTAVALAIVVAAAGFGAGSGTYAFLADTGSGTTSITAAASFEATPPGAMARDDVDGDRSWDVGEPTYDESELHAFSKESVDLLVPADVGPVDNATVSMRANSIEIRVPVVGTDGDVSIAATGGVVRAAGRRINASGGGSVGLTADGAALLNSSSVLAPGTINVTAGSIRANGSTIRSETFGFVTVAATNGGGGRLDAAGASFTAAFGNVELRSSGDTVIDSSRLEANGFSSPFFDRFGEATADLDASSATLHVDGTRIADLDDTLVYDPDGVAIAGTPASGALSPT